MFFFYVEICELIKMPSESFGQCSYPPTRRLERFSMHLVCKYVSSAALIVTQKFLKDIPYVIHTRRQGGQRLKTNPQGPFKAVRFFGRIFVLTAGRKKLRSGINHPILDSEVNKLPELWHYGGQDLYFDLLFRMTWDIAEISAFKPKKNEICLYVLVFTLFIWTVNDYPFIEGFFLQIILTCSIFSMLWHQ